MKAAGSNRDFRHTATTCANAKDVWAIWTDVANWGDWDTGLASAEGSAKAIGSTGFIIDTSGRRLPYEVVAYDAGRSYTFATKLPAGELVVRRLIEGGSPTTFTHHVTFQGIGGAFLSLFLGPQFRRALPVSMKNIVRLAEQQAS